MPGTETARNYWKEILYFRLCFQILEIWRWNVLTFFHEINSRFYSDFCLNNWRYGEKKTWKSHIHHFAELESGEMLIAQWWREACLDRDLRSTADQSLAIYCLREDSLIDLDDLACKLLPAAVLHECMYWRRGLVSCRLICIVYCLLLLSHGLLVLHVKLWSSRVLSCW